MKPVMHAWYSKWQANFAGHCVWETADGHRIEVTMVTDEKNTDCCPNISDFEYRGEVVKCVEPVSMSLTDLDILSSEKRIARARDILTHVKKTMGITPVDKVKLISMNRLSFGIKKPTEWSVN